LNIKYRHILLIASLWLGLLAAAEAEELLMVRVQMGFPETMLKLQLTLKEQGYQLSRVQRVDIGLVKFGYKTDKYRVVFFGKAEEIKRLSHDHPELIPYLPYKVAIFAEADDTLVVTANPVLLFPDAPADLKATLESLNRDLHTVFEKLREN